jgi:hypothetical protein
MVKSPPKPTKFTKCLDDDVDVRAGLFSITPREMVHFDLLYAHTESHRLGKDLGIHHRARAPDSDVIENFASE